MRVLVCGGRDYSDYRQLSFTLDGICLDRGCVHEPDQYGNWLPKGVTVISGKASGADTLALDWAVSNWCPTIEFPADWTDLSFPGAVIRTRRDGTKYDALAGHRRNQRMIDEGKPDLVVAFPGGSGTADMERRARRAGIEVKEIA